MALQVMQPLNGTGAPQFASVIATHAACCDRSRGAQCMAMGWMQCTTHSVLLPTACTWLGTCPEVACITSEWQAVQVVVGISDTAAST